MCPGLQVRVLFSSAGWDVGYLVYPCEEGLVVYKAAEPLPIFRENPAPLAKEQPKLSFQGMEDK